jgi:DNA topoisomerase-1
MVQFGQTLPRIRSRVQDDLGLQGIPRDKLLALIVRLLETTFIRVGNEEYTRANQSFGLTTLLDRHVQVQGAEIRFRFRGKSGKFHTIAINDRRLSRIVKRCRELPGQDLFQYLDDAGEPQSINSADVNEYLRQVGQEDFTSKDFRTWGGTLLAACHLAAAESLEVNLGSKSFISGAIDSVAARLGNTSSICRKCYIHPAVLTAYQDRALYDLWMTSCTNGPPVAGLTKEESALLKFLESWSSR